jgi:hypothetical protein
VASGAAQQLTTFLSREFPGTDLHPDRYGRSPYLRFELGDEVEKPDERSAQAAERAAAIFESVFPGDDDGFVTFTRWRPDDDKTFLALLPASARDAVDRQEGTDYYDDDQDRPYVRYTMAIPPRSLDYVTLFQCIANSELGQSPSLDGRAYLVNRERPLILHMYDDRGALVLAPIERALSALRLRFGHWLVKS